MRHPYFITFFSFFIMFFCLTIRTETANATTIYDLSDSSQRTVNIGSLGYGQSDDMIFMTHDLTPSIAAQNIYTTITGSLPPNSFVTFSFASLGFDNLNGRVSVVSDYFLDLGRMTGVTTAIKQVQNGAVITDSNEGNSIIFGVPSAPVVFATAQIIPEIPSVATAIIRNTSAFTVPFETAFMQVYLNGAFPRIDVSYEVSAVPVPAALPLFGLGLMAVAGTRKRRKQII